MSGTAIRVSPLGSIGANTEGPIIKEKGGAFPCW